MYNPDTEQTKPQTQDANIEQDKTNGDYNIRLRKEEKKKEKKEKKKRKKKKKGGGGGGGGTLETFCSRCPQIHIY